jgi:serine protease Do
MKRIISLFCLLLALLAGASECRADAVLPQSRAQISLSFAPLVKQVAPTVVNIYTQRLVRQRVSPLFDDPFFRQFFGDTAPGGVTRERMEKSLGSGVIVRPDGLIITSRHVIADADQIRVVLSDRREFDAKIVLSDEHVDLAILRIESKGETFPFLELKDSDEAQVGDLVLAIGNPFGVGQTVTMGIISALTHKSVGSSDLGYFIQTDAAINPGNSGGALVTMDGKLTGINAAIYSRDGGNMGIGFAVPSNMARLLINAVTQGKEHVTHPWIGIEGQEVTQDIALSLGMTQPTGFLVKSLHPASPAVKAGLKSGDVIISVNGREVEDPEAFHYRITSMTIGSTAEIGIVRQGQKSVLHVDMIAPPEYPPRKETLVAGRNPVSGAKIANLSPAVAEEIGAVDTAHGVVVTQVKENTLAARIGLQRGDIILAVNGEKIANVDDAIAALRQTPNSWRLTLRRDGNEVTVMFGG